MCSDKVDGCSYMSQCVQGLPENQLVYMELSDYSLAHDYFNRGILVEIYIYSHIYLFIYLSIYVRA